MLSKKFLHESNREPNKIWVDKGSRFYNKSIESWLQDNDIETYSTHNEGKSVATDVYIDKLDDIVHECKNIYHSIIKMKPVDKKTSTYIDFNVEIMKNPVNFRLMMIEEYKNIFAKSCPSNLLH